MVITVKRATSNNASPPNVNKNCVEYRSHFCIKVYRLNVISNIVYQYIYLYYVYTVLFVTVIETLSKSKALHCKNDQI